MNCFDLVYPLILELEGGLRLTWLRGEENWTFAGIYRKWHPKWEGWSVVLSDNWTEEQVEPLVRKFYWKLWKSSRAGEMPCPIATAYFNVVVLSGQIRGAKHLQASLNRVAGCKLQVDGVVGKRTLECVVGQTHDIQMGVALEILRGHTLYMMKLGKVWALRGWINRSFKVSKFIVQAFCLEGQDE